MKKQISVLITTNLFFALFVSGCGRQSAADALKLEKGVLM